ncbi:glycerol kinase GlpK [Glacieibacterium sp.]|uniref:glycerol kinase GlpK n=1 Tax=Glacieibacterium sp. TaxID=2860237 RepID=UPI003B00F42D
MTASDLILVLDEGTTSTRAIVFDRTGDIVAQSARPLTQSFRQPGWVEHDAAEIWAHSLSCLTDATAAVGLERIACIGLTNQRETVVFWDRRTGEPLAPAIVWQDRRSAVLCERLRTDGREALVQERTGLVLDPYFSGTKIAWALENWPVVRAAAGDGTLAVGTIDSYLLFRLTEGRVHATDATNASRTLLMDLGSCQWDERLLGLLGVPRSVLPTITDCVGSLGSTTLLGRMLPITASIGDQQAAAIGQACLTPGMVKATYGTGTFVLAQAGAARPASKHRLLSTVAWRIDGVASYALEGSIFTAGAAVQWLRDGLRIIEASAETEALARSVPDSGGVVMVPAFAGMGAPHWRPDVRGLITGITSGTSFAHIARATLEAMGHQTADLLAALAADGVVTERLRVDGGMVANDWLCQDLADTLGIPVERPRVIETTALGCAMLAGLGAGLFASLEEAAGMAQLDRVFVPAIDAATRATRRENWAHAVRQALVR